MTGAAPSAIAVGKTVDTVMRRDRGRLLAGLIARLGDFQIAEDALQEAMVSALGHWGRSGVPHSPTGWLMKVALNKGIDRLRSGSRNARKLNDFAPLQSPEAQEDDTEEIADERLRLIFACCHPALEEKSRVALTLRSVCNLTTREIADAFLDNEPTMGQRLSRAKSKIKAKGIGFSIPETEQWGDRLGTVLSTVYLIFTTGYVTDDSGPRDLCQEALFLASLLQHLRPDDPEIEGLLALLQLTEARRAARIGPDGATVPIEEQDPVTWDQTLLQSARDLLETAVARHQPGPYQIKAAIADCHMAQPEPDWRQMSFLYQSLWHHEPTAVVALNWAVVLLETGHAETALARINTLGKELQDFQPWFAARASALARLGRQTEAAAAYQQAIASAPNAANRALLEKRLKMIEVSQT
ncbi:RNA polymerase sigma factor [Halovulum sp. GXIMD14793]